MRNLPSLRESPLVALPGLAALLCGMMVAACTAQTTSPTTPRGSVQIRGYSIDVNLDLSHHSLTAKTRVDFTATKSPATIEFHLNPALHVDSVTDASGKSLSTTQKNGELTVTPSASLTPGRDVAWTFTYSGAFDVAPGSTRLVSIGEPVSYLLYRGDWFPVVGDGTQRFTSEMHVHVPAGILVLSSGPTGTPHSDTSGQRTYDFSWPYPGSPGTVIAGKFQPPVEAPGTHIRVYRIDRGSAAPPDAAPAAQDIAATAAKQYDELTAQFGPVNSGEFNVVELPNDTLPAVSAPQIAAIADNQLESADYARLLVNTIAHQWWGEQVSAASPNDAWITNGMCRYAELEYLGRTAPPEIAADAILNVSASALAYNSFPLAEAARYPEFSREFEAMTYDKGAMILRMLRWQIGDAAFQQTLRQVLAQPDKYITSAKFEQIAEAASHQNLRPFFTQWLNTTGAPTLQDKWTLYRLGNNQGFRTVGEIDEDLDLFQMPVDVQVETEGKTVNKRVEVMGPRTQFTIDTFGIPRKVSLDPERLLLRNDDAIQVRVHILRGLAKAAENNDSGAIDDYRTALALEPTSSLASYRLGEIYFQQRNYQAAEDAYRAALRGDGVPKWIEVWSDLQLGRIFDASGQRDRAINQYREAIETGDDSSGAVTLASDYLKHPYVPATGNPQ